MKKKRCDYCGRKYQPVRAWQRFCDKDCRTAAWERLHPRVDLTKSKVVPR